MNRRIIKITLLSTAFILFVFSVQSQNVVVKGQVIDKVSNEPLFAANVVVANTTQGVTTDFDGNFELKIKKGEHTIVVSYITYKTQEIKLFVEKGMEPISILMESDEAMQLDEVQIVARKNLENEMALIKERETSVKPIESIGAKEMSQKGLSNVEDGVKKISGISVASAGQIVVRGLGDRYSITTLNGQPIASPNPDNKLIPLDIFPSSTIKNVTVTKVYDAQLFADYSGAHIDISTKELVSDKFFSLGFGLGGNFATVGQDFYSMDKVSLFSKSNASHIIDAPKKEAEMAIKTSNQFDTDFTTTKSLGLPNFSGNIGYGDNIKIGNREINILATGAISSNSTTSLDNEDRTVQADGNITDEYIYDSYTEDLKMAGLFNVGTALNKTDRISYTLFFARNASNSLQHREGRDFDLNKTLNNSSVTHIYKLMTQQLHGNHTFNENWDMNWGFAYNSSSADEPDRKQVMFQIDENDNLKLFTDKANVVMRYFGNLTENDLNADFAINRKFGEEEQNKFSFGGNFKDKYRDFTSTRFYYNVNAIGDITRTIDELYNTSTYLNQSNIENGLISVNRDKQDKDAYDAGQRIYSAFTTLDLLFAKKISLNLGLRYENLEQYINYNGNKNRTLNSHDLFPALNLRYMLENNQHLRLSLSRTVTRPQFIEMAPYEYKQSYGSATIVGNENLQNSYNWNADLRFERFFEQGDMFSVTGYYKQLVNPIERIQAAQGGGTIQTFQNADLGLATGIEVEIRKTFAKVFRIGANGSYMYTNVVLSDVGNYTNKERGLQGASPYLFNVDLTYTAKLANEKNLNLALLYNFQGSRIHAVGVRQCGDIYQEAYTTVNFVASYNISKLASIKLELNNLLNQAEVYTQEIPTNDSKIEVGRRKVGLGASIGVSIKF